MAISRLHAWCVSGLWVVPDALVAGGCLLTWCVQGVKCLCLLLLICVQLKILLLFIFVVEIVSTLGEGTFGKVVCCKDR